MLDDQREKKKNEYGARRGIYRRKEDPSHAGARFFLFCRVMMHEQVNLGQAEKKES